MAKNNGENSGKSNKGLMIVLLILGFVILGAAAFGGTYIFMKSNKSASAKEVVVENTYVDLDEFTVNLADEGGKKYFKGEISLGYNSKDSKVGEELTKNSVVVRDTVIFYFKSQKAEYINNVENKDKIKQELMDAINKELVKGKITDIRFKSMIVQ